MSRNGFRWGQILKLVAAAAILFLIGKAFQHYAGEVRRQVTAIDYSLLAAGLVLCVLYRILNSSGWVMVLRSLGQPMPLRCGMRLWLLSESMRWLPGSVWGFCSRVYQATKCGIPPAIASASLPLELLLTIMAWSIVAALGLAFSGSKIDWLGLIHPRMLAVGGTAVIVVGAIVGVLLTQFPQSRWGAKLTSLRDELVALRSLSVDGQKLAGVVGLYTTLCCLNGLAFYLVIRSVTSTPVDPVAIMGINACGWLMGFLAIGAPGGIGVREAGAAYLLSTMMPLPAAIAASVLWRIIMIIDEVTCLAVCLSPNLSTHFSPRHRRELDPAV